MRPILMSPGETGFTTHGIGPLEATSCVVREELNGKYQLTLELPTESRHFDEIEDRALILVRPNPYDALQPFRISGETRTHKRLATEHAQHISYDLDGYPIAPFTAQSAAEAVRMINSGKLTANPFTLSTDLDETREMKVTVPTVERSLLGEHDESLLRRYGGELRFDMWSVELLERRGEDRGFVIAYGKNLIDLQQEKKLAELYTGVLPYWTDDETCVQGSVQNAPGNWPVPRILPVDLTDEFEEQPTAAQLNAAGAAYLVREKIGVPEVSIQASFVPPGSQGLRTLQDVRLGDTVTVRFEKLGIDVKSRVVAYDYDVLRERYVSIEIGEKKETAADAIADAKRLKKGTLDSARIGRGSVGGGKLKKNAVTEDKLADNSVTVNKIVDGAVVSMKIQDGAVTGDKVLDQAIAYAKLSENVQVLFNDIIAANQLFAGVIYSQASVSCSTLLVQGTQFLPGSWSFIDGNGNSRTFYGLKRVGT